MRVKIVPCLTQLRRMANRNNQAARRQGEEIQLYPKPIPKKDFSAEQRLPQEAMRVAGQGWRQLASETRQAWNWFAASHSRFFPRPDAEPLTGQLLYTSAAFRRLVMGLELPEAAPVLAPPPALEGLELLPDEGDSRLFRFVIRHGGPVDGLVLMVRLTRATLTPARRPQRNVAVLIRGFHPDSVTALPPDGGVAEFPMARVEVEAGARFGVWASVVRPGDGLSSGESFYDLIRS